MGASSYVGRETFALAQRGGPLTRGWLYSIG